MKPETLVLAAHEWVPNHPHFPVLLYRQAIAIHGTADANARAAEVLFARNGWPPAWRNGVYAFHHFHTTAHEALAFVSGSARLILGGPGGRELTVEAGDVAVLPAGTGHCRVSSTDDFLVVGAYPPGQSPDLQRSALSPGTHAQMMQLPCPATDPVAGANGALRELWQNEAPR